MESNRYRLLKKFVTKLYLVSIAKEKGLSIRVKMYQNASNILLSGCDLFNMSSFS